MNTLQTTKAYECSKSNATVNIANNEWINEFPGIKLEKGDQVRLLGSFVNETSSGDSIEVTDEMEINIQYSPFIKAQTFFTANQGTDLIDIGKIGDIPYSTDSFGIEPPGWWFGDGTATTAAAAARQVATFTYDCSQDNLFDDVYATGTGKVKWNTGASEWTAQNNYARTWGTNIKTYNNNATQQTATNFNERNIYADWKNFSCDNELYLAGLVKKLILPVLHSVNSSVECYNGGNFTFEDLNLNPPNAGEGMLSGVPKPGMVICTADIAGATGFYDEDGNAYFENNVSTGKCNLVAGPQSVIGEILAVRPMKHLIRNAWENCFEVYVHNWISPASIRNKPIAVNNVVGTTLTNVNSVRQGDRTANLVTGLANVNCIVQPHGSSETTKNYNTNSTFNNLNGSVNKGATSMANPSNNNMLAGNPDCFNYDTPTAGASGTFIGGTADGNIGRGFTDFKETCMDNDLDEFKVGYGKSQGLSFLWNGTYGNQHRYPHLQIPTPNPNFIENRLRQSNQFVLTRAGANITLSISSQDLLIESTSNPITSGVPVVPPQMGAYIICNPSTMIDIVNGVYGRIDVGRVDGRIARWWMDYSYQLHDSEYNERHYAGNAFTQTGPFTAGHEPGDNTAGGQAPYQSVVAGIPARNEYRYNVEFMGKPSTQNYRKRKVPVFGGNEPYQTNLISAIGNFAFATGVGPCDTTDPNFVGDGSGNIMSLRYGFNEGLGPHGWVATGTPPVAPSHAHFGAPFVNCGYETSLNSIHFQDKECGDCNLGINYETGVPNGNWFYFYNSTIGNVTTNTVTIDKGDLLDTRQETPVVGAYVKFFGFVAFNEKDVFVTNVVQINPQRFTITLSELFIADIATNTNIYISPTAAGSITGCGTEAIAWAGDLLIMREHTAKYNVPNGFYTEDDLGNTINDRLHFNNNKYKQVFGIGGEVPTNVGKREEAMASQNSVIYGNFVHTYLPDLNFGFTPVTQTIAENTNLTASTKEMTGEIYTYESQVDGLGNLIFYYPYNLPAYNGTTVRKITDHSNTYPTMVGSHTKLYSVPYLKYDRLNKQIHLIRLRGGALNQADANVATGPPIVFENWKLKDSRFVGYYEGLRDLRCHQNGENVLNANGSAYSAVWRTRLNRNLLSNGGAAKIFCGANNLTISYVEQTNRFSINNMYTPLRPHTSENKDGTASFGVDDAVPSAIIAAELTGGTEDMLSGIYINKLNGDVFTRQNYGINWFNDEIFDTISQADLTTRGDNFLDTMGFTSTQLAAFDNSFTNANLFVFNGLNDQTGTAIRVGAKITPSINGANPFANSCSLIAPMQQYFVEVETDDFFADSPATKGKNPYYYIGSDFPSKEFFGNDNGAKLPVIGICARNFHSMNFSFDLGASSISYTVDEDVTLTSIRTAIYTSDLKTPANLSKFSSIIYLITKNKFYYSLPQENQITKSQIIESNYSAPYQPYFFNQAPSNYRSNPPPIIPRNYFTNTGVVPENIDSDDDEF